MPACSTCGKHAPDARFCIWCSSALVASDIATRYQPKEDQRTRPGAVIMGAVVGIVGMVSSVFWGVWFGGDPTVVSVFVLVSIFIAGLVAASMARGSETKNGKNAGLWASIAVVIVGTILAIGPVILYFIIFSFFALALTVGLALPFLIFLLIVLALIPPLLVAFGAGLGFLGGGVVRLIRTNHTKRIRV